MDTKKGPAPKGPALVVVLLVGSLLAVVYVWRVVEVAYFRNDNEPVKVSEAPLSLLIPTWLLVIANIYFGIDANLTVDVAQRAAGTLLGVQP